MTERDDRDWARLARAAIAQRAAMGDPTITTIMRNAGTWRNLVNHASDDPAKRAAATRLSAAKLRELERGLKWGTGAADATLAGGDPWLEEDRPDMPMDAVIFAYFKGTGEVRALLPEDPEERQKMIRFIRRHLAVVDLGE